MTTKTTKRTGCGCAATKKKSKPKNVGKLINPDLLPKPSRAETKFLKGVTTTPVTIPEKCSGWGCSAPGHTVNYNISKASATPFVKAFGRNTNNADIQAIKAGSTRNADGSITMTDAAFGKFVGVMKKKYPDKIAYQYCRAGLYC
jgi:hypothetical protein